MRPCTLPTPIHPVSSAALRTEPYRPLLTVHSHHRLQCQKRGRERAMQVPDCMFSHSTIAARHCCTSPRSICACSATVADQRRALLLRRSDAMSMDVVEAQWKAYVGDLRKSGTFSSALAIADVSGSMSGTPMHVRGPTQHLPASLLSGC